LKIFGNVTVPVYVSPRSGYISFSGDGSKSLSKEAEVWTTLDKPLELSETEFTLAGKVRYDLKEVEKGRRYKLTFWAIPGSETTYKGFLTFKTNYEDHPEVKFVIRVHFKKASIFGK
jgi:hypothetical protein